MKQRLEDRSVLIGDYIVSTGATVRSAARKFGISKSTVHKDVNERLGSLSPGLHRRVRLVLEKNLAERHIRGGLATKNKYVEIKKKK